MYSINGRKVFDAHFHIGNWGERVCFGHTVRPLLPQGIKYVPGQEHRNIDDIRSYFDAYGISGGIVMCNYLADDPEYSLIALNHAAIEAAKAIDTLYAALFTSPKDNEWAYASEALELIPNENVRAIKLTPTHWEDFSPDPASWNSGIRGRMEKILDAAKRNGLIVQFHTGLMNSEPLMFEGFLKEFGRDIDVYLVHSGETCYPCMQYATLLRQWLDCGYRVYSDVALAPGFVLPKLLSVLTGDEIGHILFGTDAPWGNFPSEFWKVESLDAPDHVKNAIFYDNAQKLYGFPGNLHG